MEKWKDIKGYEGYYQVSDLGNVKSLERTVKGRWGLMNKKECILKNALSGDYYQTRLFKDGKCYNILTHQLVAIAFLNHIPCGHKIVVDHDDENKLNNRADNLVLMTSRENINKSKRNGTSRFKGVHLHKITGKYQSNIIINGKRKYLGLFTNELDASNAYQDKLKQIENG